MVRMKNKVVQFPKTLQPSSKGPNDEPKILFTFGGQRFTIQWTVVQVSAKPADVISIERYRREQRSRQTQI
jgi:hypothetical protein